MEESIKSQQQISNLLNLKQDIQELPFREKESLTNLLDKISDLTNDMFGHSNSYKDKIQTLVFIPDSFYSTPEDYKTSWNNGLDDLYSIINQMLAEFGHEADDKFNENKKSQKRIIDEKVFPTIPNSLESTTNTDNTEDNDLKIVFSPSTFEETDQAKAEPEPTNKNRLGDFFKSNKNQKPQTKKPIKATPKPIKEDIYRSRIDSYMQKKIHEIDNKNPNKVISILLLPFKLIGDFFKYLWRIADDFATLVEKDFKEFNKPSKKSIEKNLKKENAKTEKSLQKSALQKKNRELKDEKNKKGS